MNKAHTPNLEVVVIAVARLGGDRKFVDTEDVAVEAFRLAPGKFGWRKYPERIDLDQVRRALSRAQRSGSLLTGNVRTGWMLSSQGVAWLESREKELQSLDDYRRGSVSDGIDMERERLRGTHAWAKYSREQADQITLNDFYQFVRMNEYFSNEKRHERYTIVENATSGDVELSRLWHILQERFTEQAEKQDA